MSVETHRVLIGSCGWKHPSWLDDFYSEDLPEEWQLGFYSNEFPVVYVSTADWIDEDDLSQWTEDVSDSFRFILEVSADILIDEAKLNIALDKIKMLDEFCLALVFQLNPTLCNDIALLQKNITSGQAIAPVCIDKCGLSLNEDINSLLENNNVSEIWNGESNNNEIAKHSPLFISRVSSDGLDMKELRKVIEVNLSASSEECTSVLFIEGNPPSLALLRNADILLNLL